MKKTEWNTKISSRKLWSMLAGVVISMLVLLGADAGTTEKVTGLIGAVGTIAVYIFAEASVDAARKDEDNAD